MKQLTIDKKLFGVFAAMLSITLLLNGLLVFQARQNSHRMDLVLNRYSAKFAIGDGIALATVEMQGAQRGLMLSYLARDAASAPPYIALYAASTAHIKALLAELKPLTDSPEEAKIASSVQTSATAWEPRFKELAALCAAGRIPQAYALRTQNKVISATMHDAAGQLVAQQKRAMEAAQLDSEHAALQSNWITGISAILSLLIGFVVILIVRQIVRQLRNTVESLQLGASELSAGANQIATSSNSLVQGTTEQASAIVQTSAATEQITAMARRNSDHANHASELMRQTSTAVSDANISLEQMQESMDEINESSARVGKIIKVIEQIAFQTNVLALNAAVESARAGDAGKGFAVVADEVRSLAQRSAKAAEETSNLIAESIAKTRLGHERLLLVTQAIESITEGAAQVSVLVDGVKTGSDEQAKGAGQISIAMTGIEKVTQNSAAGAEQGAATGQQMFAQADSLQTIVDELHAMVG